MIVEESRINYDGTFEIVQVEYPDDYVMPGLHPNTEPNDYNAFLAGLMEGYQNG